MRCVKASPNIGLGPPAHLPPPPRFDVETARGVPRYSPEVRNWNLGRDNCKIKGGIVAVRLRDNLPGMRLLMRLIGPPDRVTRRRDHSPPCVSSSSTC